MLVAVYACVVPISYVEFIHKNTATTTAGSPFFFAQINFIRRAL